MRVYKMAPFACAMNFRFGDVPKKKKRFYLAKILLIDLNFFILIAQHKEQCEDVFDDKWQRASKKKRWLLRFVYAVSDIAKANENIPRD